MKRQTLLQRSIVLSVFVGTTAAFAGTEQEQDFFEGSVSLFPQPEAVEVVRTVGNIERDRMTLAIARSGVTAQQFANEGVVVRVLAARSVESLQQLDAASGNRFLLLSLEWKNITPRAIVRSGKSDRTMGAGSLFGGKASAGAGSRSEVKKDVAYKVPKWADHLFIVADGVAYAPHRAGAQLVSGAGPGDSLTLARFGQAQQQWYAFEVPAETRSLALYFFDYNKGNIVLPLTGTAPVLEPDQAIRGDAARRVSRRDIDLIAGPVRFADEYRGIKAPRGGKFAFVDLIGKSLGGSAARRSIFQMDIGKYAWLQGDGGYLYAAVQSSNGSGVMRFTPEVYKWDQAVFLVPEHGENFMLRLRFGADVSVLPLGSSPPTSVPESFAQYVDGDVMKLHVFGKRSDNGKLIVDLGAEAVTGGKGIELSPYRQFFASTQGEQVPVDRSATQSLAHGAASSMLVPPGSLLRFSLVFAAPDAAAIAYKGVKSSGEIALVQMPQAGDEVVLAAITEIDQRITGKPRSEPASRRPAAQARPASERSAQSGAATRSAAKILETIRLPPLLKEGAVPEREPNDDFEQAMELPATFKVFGQTKSREDDYFRFRAVGEPRLWTLNVRGKTIDELSLLDSSGRAIATRRKARGEDTTTVNNLYLLPGWHSVKVKGSGAVAGEYVFQAVPGEPPSVASEREPNDDKSRAQRLRFGQPIDGIYTSGDYDHYRFSISAPALVRVSIQPADGMTVVVAGLKSSTRTSKTPGQLFSYEAQFQPGDYSFVVRFNGKDKRPKPYRLLLERLSLFTPDKGPEVTSEAEITLLLDGADQAVKAFWDEGQRIDLNLVLSNNGTQQRKLALRSACSNYLWRSTLPNEAITLGPGQSKRIPVVVNIGAQTPSNEAVRIAVQAETAELRVETNVDIQPRCDVPPVNPGPDHRIPRALLGGLDLAWSSLGGYLPDVEEKYRSHASRRMAIIDGYTPLSSPWNVYGDFPAEVTLRLAAKAPVLGIILDPTGCTAGGTVRRFELLASSDGQVFELLTAGTVSTLQKEQVFSLPRPVEAGVLKLRILSTWENDKSGRACLGELKALADPEVDYSGGEGWNIADPGLGGHAVWSSFKANGPTLPEMLSAEGSSRSFPADPDNPNEWVLGFHHNRAAQLREIRWHRQVANRRVNELSRVAVAVSQNSPLGPWQSAGVLSIDRSRDVASLSFDTPIWARFVKFSSTDPDRATPWQLPARLQIFERAASPGYRSILGEWGHYSRNGVFEFLEEASAASAAKVTLVTANGSKATARPLPMGETVAGQVQRGVDEAWYRLSVPAGRNRLTIELSGMPTLLAMPRLFNARGTRVELEQHETSAVRAYFSASVSPGDYLLRVYEPVLQTVVAWDNSGSVKPYAPSIYQALEEFARGVAPETELVNFLPFQDDKYELLSKEWTDQPFLLAAALNNYDRSDGSSDAEGNLLAAVKYLRGREGNRTVLVLTDAASGTTDSRPLWQSLSQVLPHVFTVELHGPGDFIKQQDKMQDWADANGGTYTMFQTQPDLDMAFDRALCTMRRPAGYSLSVVAEYQKPQGPGSLQVSVDRKVAATSAVEIILDASGSMYKKIGDQTRIAVAKTVLTELLQTTIPAGTPLALRIYGHKEPRSCRSDLELPLKPLVSSEALSIIKSIDPQDRSRTPLAASLQLVAADLKQADGPKLVVLLTDGEESCDGDPEAAIRLLKQELADVKLNIVGMAIDSDVAKQQFSTWAKIGGGLYFEANSPQALQAALERALFPKYQLIDSNGDVAVEGVADGRPIAVAAGVYQLKVLTTPARAMGEIRIEEGKNVKITVGAP